MWREINNLWSERENNLNQLEKEYKSSNITEQIETLLINLNNLIKQIENTFYDVDGIIFNAHECFVNILQTSGSEKREHLFLFSKEEISTFFEKIFEAKNAEKKTT